MEVIKINIEDGLYEKKLLNCLWHKKGDETFDKEILEVLIKLCRHDLINESHFKELRFADKEKEILSSIDIVSACNNKEIAARWCDYIQEVDKNKRPNYLKICSSNYFEIYKATKDYEYLIRGLQLIRKAKNWFENELEEIYTSIKEEVIECVFPYWRKMPEAFY